MISEHAREQIDKAQFDEALFLLLTLNHPTWSEPLRYVSSAKDVTSQGVLYKATDFTVPLPPQTKNDISDVTVSITDINREVSRNLRALTDRRTGSATLAVVFSNDPNKYEVKPMNFRFSLPTITTRVVTLSLTLGPGLKEIYPVHKYRPATHPGAF